MSKGSLYLKFIYISLTPPSSPLIVHSLVHQAHFNTQSLLHAPLDVEVLNPVTAKTWLAEPYVHPLEILAPLSDTLLTFDPTPKMVTLARGFVSLYVPLAEA
jgi:hypothetical protein